MKKFYLLLVLLVPFFAMISVISVMAEGDESIPADADTSRDATTSETTTEDVSTSEIQITDEQKKNIIDNCGSIRAKLKELQKSDSRIRVELGDAYDQILTKYITPFGVRLVENGLSSAALVENQNALARVRALFTNDFISYQKSLEELASMNCEVEPQKFYNELSLVRSRREIMKQDTLRMRSLLSEHINLANGLKGKL